MVTPDWFIVPCMYVILTLPGLFSPYACTLKLYAGKSLLFQHTHLNTSTTGQRLLSDVKQVEACWVNGTEALVQKCSSAWCASRHLFMLWPQTSGFPKAYNLANQNSFPTQPESAVKCQCGWPFLICVFTHVAVCAELAAYMEVACLDLPCTSLTKWRSFLPTYITERRRFSSEKACWVCGDNICVNLKTHKLRYYTRRTTNVNRHENFSTLLCKLNFTFYRHSVRSHATDFFSNVRSSLW